MQGEKLWKATWYVPSGVFLEVRYILYEMLLPVQSILERVYLLMLNARLVVY